MDTDADGAELKRGKRKRRLRELREFARILNPLPSVVLQYSKTECRRELGIVDEKQSPVSRAVM